MEKGKDFIGRIDLDGYIYSVSGGHKLKVGMDLQAVSELEKDRDAIIEKYMKLYDDACAAGIRTKEKPQSEINQEIISALKDLKDEIGQLKQMEIKL